METYHQIRWYNCLHYVKYYYYLALKGQCFLERDAAYISTTEVGDI